MKISSKQIQEMIPKYRTPDEIIAKIKNANEQMDEMINHAINEKNKY